MENTKYTEEFKQSIVSLYESGKSSTQICKEYGMSSSKLHKWIKKYTKVQVSETETMTMAEIKKMQKKLALLEEKNIILKKQWLSSKGNPGKSRTDYPVFKGLYEKNRRLQLWKKNGSFSCYFCSHKNMAKSKISE